MKVKLSLLCILFLILSSDLSAQVWKKLSKEKITNPPMKEYNTDSHSEFRLDRGECFLPKDHVEICFDDVIEDSRCPPNVQCSRAGRVILKLIMTLQEGTKYDLVFGWGQDTIINNYYILLSRISPKGVKKQADIFVANLDKLESNAKIIGYRPYQQDVCSGWIINMNGDTIISNDHKLRGKVKKDAQFPINAFIEKSKRDVERCSKKDTISAFWLRRVLILD